MYFEGCLNIVHLFDERLLPFERVIQGEGKCQNINSAVYYRGSTKNIPHS